MSTELVTTEQTPAMSAVMAAVVDKDVDATKVRELVAVQFQLQEAEAKKAYAMALVGFQSELHIINKGDDNRGKRYAKIDRIWRETRPLREKYGIGVTWHTIHVDPATHVCIMDGMIVHAGGHCVDIHYEVPVPDAIMSREGKAVQNKAQIMGSATTYGIRYGTCAVLGIILGDDDDGYAAGGKVLRDIKPPVDSGQIAKLRDLLEESGTPEDILANWAGVERIEDLPRELFDKGVAKLEATIEAKTASAGVAEVLEAE